MEYLTNYWVVLPHFCCNDVYLSKERRLNKNDPDWCSRWWDLADWQWKVGFTSRAIRHFCQYRQPYSIHISKVPPLGASIDPLWYNTIVLLSTYGSADFWPKMDLVRPKVTQNVPFPFQYFSMLLIHYVMYYILSLEARWKAAVGAKIALKC